MIEYERLTRPAPIAAALFLLAMTTAGCSALELYQGNASATARAEATKIAADEPTVGVLEGALTAAQATQESLIAGATELAAVVSALEATPTSAPPADDALPLPASAETIIYGSVPIDSDRLNIIAALAFDTDRRLLVATRAGEIYVLPDRDGDGVADETRLIFADDAQVLNQVAGLIARGRALVLINGQRLSLLRDGDSDGVLETVRHLNEGLPADQSPLQASNGIVESPDGRLFTVDINSGEILRIVLRE